jgi:hypothetical protein
MTKSIFKSRTFWFNVVTAVVTYGGHLPPEYAFYVNVIGNIILRRLTKTPVTVLPATETT